MVGDVTAATIWQELLQGHWVVVERRDTSSRRTLILRKATEAERSSRAFTPIERETVNMAMRAWSLKMIAAELGLSTSRVAEVLGRVRAKLGAPTHADLLRMVGTFGCTRNPPVPARMPRERNHPLTREKSLPKRTFAESEALI